MTEPCFSEPHITSAGRPVSEAYVFRANFLGHSQWQYTNCAAVSSTVHPRPFISPPPSWMLPLRDGRRKRCWASPGSSKVPGLMHHAHNPREGGSLRKPLSSVAVKELWKPIGTELHCSLLSWCGFGPQHNNIFDARLETHPLRLHLKWAIKRPLKSRGPLWHSSDDGS